MGRHRVFPFRSSRRRASIRLYQVIFPNESGWYYLYCAWRQFHSFAATYGDRIELARKKEELTPTPGKGGILEAEKKGTGGIILMSHLGSYEIAARAFQRAGLKLLLIMGEKEAKQVARDQREALKEQGIHYSGGHAGRRILSWAGWRRSSLSEKGVSFPWPGIWSGPNSAPVCR